MVELPQGEIVEVRRGGADVLARLTNDMARLGRSGHIRIERRPKQIMPRVSQIVLREGQPVIALHEAEILLTGLEALLEIESDCSALDATISLHRLEREDIDVIVKLYPAASIDLNAEHITNQQQGQDQWWTKTQTLKSTWKRQQRLPEIEASLEAPEFIRQKSKAMLERHGSIGEMLCPGQTLIFDSTEPAKLFQLSSYLAKHGRPILVISRQEVEQLNVEYDLPIESCSWLSNSKSEYSLDPSLESIRKKIDSFLWGNLRAVIAFEGLEYLASIHGDERMIGMIRDICDGVRLEDHLLLVTADLNAFGLSNRQLLARELDQITLETLEHWVLQDDLLLDHPICATPSQEEAQWVETQLKKALGKETSASTTNYDAMHGISGGSQAMDLEDISSATNNLSALIQDWADDSENEIQSDIQTAIEDSPVQPDGPSDDWKPTFHSANNGDVGQKIEAQQRVNPQFSGEDNALEVIISEETNDVIAQPIGEENSSAELVSPLPTGPRKATVMKRSKRASKLPPILNRTHTMQVNAALQVAKEAPQLPELIVASSPEKHLSSSIQEHDIKQKKAVDDNLFPIKFEQDSELQQASIQKSAKRNATLPATEKGPTLLDGISNVKPIGTKTNLTPSMVLSGNRIDQDDADVRESASRSQSTKTIKSIVEDWNQKSTKTQMKNSALYDEEGNEIQRYGGQ